MRLKQHLRRSIGDRVGMLRDGLASTEESLKILEKTKDITVLNHPFNIGIGGAILTGFHFFLRNNFDYLVLIYGDVCHDTKKDVPVASYPVMRQCLVPGFLGKMLPVQPLLPDS